MEVYGGMRAGDSKLLLFVYHLNGYKIFKNIL